MPTIAERQQQRCASPQVEEYRSRLQRSKRIRRSRAIGTNTRVKKNVFVPEESPPRFTHGFHHNPFICGVGGGGGAVRGKKNKNARRVRPKSAPRERLHQATATTAANCIPLAAERFRDTTYELAGRENPHTVDRRRRQHTASTPPRLTTFPAGKLNEVALAQQRRKLDRLAQLEFGGGGSITSTTIAATSTSNSKERRTTTTTATSNRTRSKQQQRPQQRRSQSLGRRPESAPLLREPSFLLSSSCVSPAPSQPESSVLLLDLEAEAAASSSSVAAHNSNNPAMPDGDGMDYHAPSGTGFLASNSKDNNNDKPQQSVSSPGTSKHISEPPQQEQQQQQQQKPFDYDRESGTGFLTTSPKTAVTYKPPLASRSRTLASAGTTAQSSSSARGRRPPRASRSRSDTPPPQQQQQPRRRRSHSSSSAVGHRSDAKAQQQPQEQPRRRRSHSSSSVVEHRSDTQQLQQPQKLRRRSHSSSSVGRSLSKSRSTKNDNNDENNINNKHTRRRFRDDNSIDYYRDADVDADYYDDEDETYYTTTHHSANAGAACDDPCSSDNLRLGILAGQDVAERLSSCIALAVTAPCEDHDRVLQQHHHRHNNNASRSSSSWKPRPRAMDDNYYATDGGTATGSSTSSHNSKKPSQPRLRAMDDNDAFLAVDRASGDNVARSRGVGGLCAANSRGNVSDDNCLVGRRSELAFDDNFDKLQQRNKADQYILDADDACSIVEEDLSRISHESDGDTSSFWGPSPAPPATALHSEETARQKTRSDRDLIGPPQILKITRFDQQSPTSILDDPFAAASAGATKPSRADEAMSALTYSPDRHGSPPRRPHGSYDDKLNNEGGNDSNNNNNKVSSTPWDESSSKRRQQLLQPLAQTRSPDAEPSFDEALEHNRGRPPVSPGRIRSLVDSSVSTGQPSPSSFRRKSLEHAKPRQDEQQPPQQQEQSTTTAPSVSSDALLWDLRITELFHREHAGAAGSPARSSEKSRCEPEGVPSESAVSTAGSDRKKHDPLAAMVGRTLDNIQRDKEIAQLQEKVKESGAALEHTKRELEISRAEMTKRSQAFEEASASIFRERIDVEEKLRREMKSNERFKKQMQELQKEVSRLGNAIGKTDVTGKADGETAKAVERLSADLLSLRSEVVDLRAQLAEAQAVSLAKDKEIDKLRCQRDDAQSQLSGLNQKVKRLERETITLRARETVSGQQEKDVASRYEEQVRNLQVALEEANREVIDQAEKKKHLERELSEMQVATMKFAVEVEDLKKQMEKTREEADKKVSAGDAEAKKLQNELSEIKQKLSQTNSEIINQAAAHLKEKGRLQSELQQTRKVAEVLQSKVSNMDQELAETLEENEKQRSVIDEGSRAGARNSPAVFIDILRKTLDPTRAQQSSPSD